jgi:hypothetical protein
MSNAFLLFIAQFCMIFLLGVQSLNVRDGHYVGAAITSLLLGIVGFTITSIIGKLHIEDLMTVVGCSFLVAGPLGIVSAMASHGWLVEHFRRLK